MGWITQADIDKSREELRGYHELYRFRYDENCGVFCDIYENDDGDKKFVVRNYRRGGKAEYFKVQFAAEERMKYLSSQEAEQDEGMVRCYDETERDNSIGLPAIPEHN
jgi:hypothetical protein